MSEIPEPCNHATFEYLCAGCFHGMLNEIKKLERDLAIAKEALESVSGLDCLRSAVKPCGVCISCEARTALSRLAGRDK